MHMVNYYLENNLQRGVCEDLYYTNTRNGDLSVPKNILETILTIIFYIVSSISSFNLFKLTIVADVSFSLCQNI